MARVAAVKKVTKARTTTRVPSMSNKRAPGMDKAVNKTPRIKPTFATSTSVGAKRGATAGSAAKTKVIKNTFSSSTGAKTRVGPKAAGGATPTKKAAAGRGASVVKKTWSSSTGTAARVGKRGATGSAMKTVKLASAGNAKKIIGGNPKTRGTAVNPIVKKVSLTNARPKTSGMKGTVTTRRLSKKTVSTKK